MRQFGLAGNPLSHSYSAGYFSNKFIKEHINDVIYRNFQVNSCEAILDLFKQHTNLEGLNITIPYKVQIIQHLDLTDDVALKIGAINTVKKIKKNDGYLLKGYNTDVYGFSQSIKPHLSIQHERALILGCGGASKAVFHVLNNIGIQCLFVSRSKRANNIIGYNELNEHVLHSHKLVVNTTPAGMFPEINNCPGINYEHLSAHHLVYDLVYNPAETLFIHKAKQMGAVTLNGIEMLHLQAEKAWEIWNNDQEE